MKLTKKAKRELDAVLTKLLRANSKLYSDQVAVCLVQKQSTTTLDFTREKDNRVLYEINKEYGSEICFYNDVANKLCRFIDSH